MAKSFRTRKRGTPRQIGKKFPVMEKKKLPAKISPKYRKRYAKVEFVGTIADLNKREDLELVTSSQDVKEIIDRLGIRPEDFGGFFVKIKDGEYEEVYGFAGNVPYLWKYIYSVSPRLPGGGKTRFIKLSVDIFDGDRERTLTVNIPRGQKVDMANIKAHLPQRYRESSQVLQWERK